MWVTALLNLTKTSKQPNLLYQPLYRTKPDNPLNIANNQTNEGYPK